VAQDRQPLASTSEVADYLDVPARTLDMWAYRGTGPRYSRVGRYRRYRWSDVERWLDEQSRAAAA
jgi:excisionase family DNA binding protein